MRLHICWTFVVRQEGALLFQQSLDEYLAKLAKFSEDQKTFLKVIISQVLFEIRPARELQESLRNKSVASASTEFNLFALIPSARSDADVDNA